MKISKLPPLFSHLIYMTKTNYILPLKKRKLNSRKTFNTTHFVDFMAFEISWYEF